MVVVTKYGSYPDNFAKYVRPTKLADFDVAVLKKRANTIKNESKTALQALRNAHAFVAALPQGFDREDKSASWILRKGRGQCNTKTTLFLALIRAMGVPCRVRAWKVKKVVHKQHFPLFVYWFTPRTTLFTYPEVFHNKKWMLLSEALRAKEHPSWSACPFDDAANRSAPLKKEWVSEDLGVFWHPDTFFEQYGTNSDGWRRLAFPFAQLFLNR